MAEMKPQKNRRQVILRRAAEIFAHQGVARTSFEDIASAAGIKREAIYYYFKSRAEILVEILLPRSNSLLAELDRIMRSGLSSAEKLEAATQVHLDAYNPSYIEMSVALKENLFLAESPKLKQLKSVWNRYGKLWTRLIAEGQERGEFKRDMNAKIASFAILGMCNWVSRWYKPNKDISISEIGRTFSSIAASGLRASQVHRELNAGRRRARSA